VKVIDDARLQNALVPRTGLERERASACDLGQHRLYSRAVSRKMAKRCPQFHGRLGWKEQISRERNVVDLGNNERQLHGAQPGPKLVGFVIQFGLPEKFFNELEQHLSKQFDRRAGFKEYVTATRGDGWRAICHVEGGKAWTEVDADTWVPITI
jgi:hypothetical protein